MSSRVVFRPQAQEEALEARDWYEVHRLGLGRQFVDAVDVAVAAIAERPLGFPRVHGEIRRAVLRRFPYAVFFRLAADQIVVLGVLHGHRDPRTWQSRR